ncbi:putative membrane-associated kinase regulator 4 [Cinnamomum micranthum f. kanehirae]|uniref:Putative membrane-associated kinase regulator 4 n=1 Tax=Cinnamomum micranthum f. kanehirae TaxID=337451 RepID=A0A3S3R791_9MAGN|nr:putative membrane-associated kinase regulator 4 [Cinnamomum micranthum f. kanehirae]
MAIDQTPFDPTDDDYIDMDISSATFFCYSITSPNREFEFHMSSNTYEKEPTTSPADELFYKGKLLPLHLPPRLQMVQKLLQNTNSPTHESLQTESYEEYLTTNTTTPFESCNISPSDSLPVSRELNRDEYFYECPPDEDASFIDHPKKSWSKKLKLIRHSSLGLKLKASRAYIKSLFSKSGCSDESCAASARNCDEYTVSKAKECLNKYMKVARKNPFGQIQRERYPVAAALATNIGDDKVFKDGSSHRRSFSGAIKHHSGTKSTSSSSSSSSNSSSSSSNSSSLSANSKRFYELHLLKRSSSANSEVESSIQGAIAHCKQSQQLFCARKSVSEVGFCSLPSSRISTCEKREWPEMCRG